MRLSKDEMAILSGLLDQGLDLPEDARDRWLKDLQEPFAGARALLSQMIAWEAGGADESFLESLPKVTDTNAPHAIPAWVLQAGSRIGIYVLLRELGQGGMSTVWLARRTDELIQRQVALKLPHLHLQGARFAERFARERDILANLTHPHIAHLYDAGISVEGQPFLAMEFVAGKMLTDYCASRQLSLEERLQLFLQVLAAVEYAHTQGVIHRDLKPSNILVRDGGQVVLLDFGIAKLIGEGQAGQAELTLYGGAALTPHYASPEQIRGEALGPATDVYSLGVILYEILSGQRPYELSGSSLGELEQAILTAEPRRPSEAVTERPRTGNTAAPAETPRSRLRGDLDTIVLKALKKSPPERYASAGAFADDLQRYLRGDAVSARPDSLAYRLRKMASRHRTALLSVVATVAVIAAVLAGADALKHRVGAPVASMAGETSFAPPPHSVAVLPFLDMSEKRDQEYFSDGLTEELLNSLARINELQVAGRTSAFSFKGTGASLGAIARALNVGAILEGSVRRSGQRIRITAQLINAVNGYQIWSQTYDRDLVDTLEVQTEIARTVTSALKVRLLGDSIERIEAGGTRNPDAMDAYLRAASRESYRDQISGYSDTIRLDPLYARAYAARSMAEGMSAGFGASVSMRGGLYKSAEADARRAIELAPELPDGHAALANWAEQTLDFALASEEYERAVALGPGNARALMRYGSFAAWIGRTEVGIAASRRAVALDPLYALARVYESGALAAARRYGEAIAAAKAALAIGKDDRDARGVLGLAHYGMGDFDSSRAACEPDPGSICLPTLAMAYEKLGRHTDAEAALARAMAAQGDAQAYQYAEVYAQWGSTDKALEWLQTALRLRDAGLVSLRTDALLDPLRALPRFQAIERALTFPPDAAPAAVPVSDVDPSARNPAPGDARIGTLPSSLNQ